MLKMETAKWFRFTIGFVHSADRFSTLRGTAEINDFYVFNEIVNYTRHPERLPAEWVKNKEKDSWETGENRRTVIIEFTGASRES